MATFFGDYRTPELVPSAVRDAFRFCLCARHPDLIDRVREFSFDQPQPSRFPLSLSRARVELRNPRMPLHIAVEWMDIERLAMFGPRAGAEHRKVFEKWVRIIRAQGPIVPGLMDPVQGWDADGAPVDDEQHVSIPPLEHPMYVGKIRSIE